MHKNFYAKLYSHHLIVRYFRPTKLSTFIVTKAYKIKNLIYEQIVDAPPVNLSEGGVIKDSVDNIMEITRNGIDSKVIFE